MTRILYDSVTAANIPVTAQMVAGYVDGRYAWSAADWARFPAAVHVRIAVFASTNDGHVLDVERGDATPAQAVGWVQRRRAAGVDPTVYCGLASSGYSWADVRAAFQAQGVPEPHYWVAAYPGIGAALYPGSVAHQYANPGPYDLSVVADYWPGVDVSPTGNVVSNAPGTIPVAPGALTTTTTPQEADVTIDELVSVLRSEGVSGAGDLSRWDAPMRTIVNQETTKVLRSEGVSGAADVGRLVAALVPAIVAALPSGQTLTEADVETAVRNVFHGA